MEYKGGLGLLGTRSGIRARNKEIKELYLSGEFDGVELAKKFHLSKPAIYQILSGRQLYCTICTKKLDKDSAHNTNFCKDCHAAREVETLRRREERIRVHKEEVEKRKEERHLKALAKERERVEHIKVQREGVMYNCFACKKDFRAMRKLQQRHGQKFCSKCRTHLFGNPTLTGGRDRTREIRRMWDNHTCQECRIVWKMGQRRFDVHHLKGLCGKKSHGYDSYAALNDLMTLCHRCHMSKHVDSKKMRRHSTLASATIRNPEILRLYKEGRTKEQLAAWYKISTQSIYNIIRE